MTLPGDYSLAVKVAFGETKFDTAYTFTDLTSQVQEIRIRRGRTSPFDVVYAAGTATIVLADKDRDFDPLNTGSPYRSGGATQILPDRPVQITADDSAASEEYLFFGHISPTAGWQFDYQPDPAYSRVTISAVDKLAALARYEVEQVDDADDEANWVREGDATGTRVQHVVNTKMGISSVHYEIDTGVHTMPATPWGETALAHCQKAALAEAGALYCANYGDIRFEDRHVSWTDSRKTTSQETFSDDGSNVPYLHDSLQFGYITDVHDRVIAQRVDGDPQTREAASNPSNTMTRTGLLLETEAQALANADLWFDIFSTASFSPHSLAIRPLTSSGARDAALQLELRDRVTVEYTPPNTGDNTQIVVDCFIESIEHVITPGDWVTTFTFSSAEQDLWDDVYLRLDTGTLDSSTNGVLAY